MRRRSDEEHALEAERKRLLSKLHDVHVQMAEARIARTGAGPNRYIHVSQRTFAAMKRTAEKRCTSIREVADEAINAALDRAQRRR